MDSILSPFNRAQDLVPACQQLFVAEIPVLVQAEWNGLPAIPLLRAQLRRLPTATEPRQVSLL